MSALGLETDFVGAGRARVTGVVQNGHLNFHGIGHGGFIYTLADAAFALASNSHGVQAVALSVHMEYLLPARVGDQLEAIAEEIHLGGRSALYRVQVKREGALIALFTGLVYRRASEE